ncbi:MAG: shikimate kinase [Oscillospiraceae bacterium]
MKTFGLLGEKLTHSFSPQIHARLADYEYKLYEKAPEEVEDFLRSGSFDGLNVTIPYKKAVMPFCAELSESAKKIGSVNTIIRRDDKTLYGDNTDYFGFLYMLGKTGVEVSGKKALILGSGGASLAVSAALTDSGASEIIVISRGGENNYENLQRHYDAQIIVNATPVGMYPHNGVSPLALSNFAGCACVLDLIYNPLKTKLLLSAQALGIPCAGGLSMLVAQAKKARELFLGESVDNGIIDVITDEISQEERNIVLIGMPGCGKSSIGRELAGITGRKFFDTDVMIETKAGKTIPRIFAEDGEAVFRAVESEALAEATAEHGCVIATGGGIVTQPVNLDLIRQNGVAVFLDRAIDELPSCGRPLSAGRGTDILAKERRPLYLKWSDYKFIVCGISETANNIKEKLAL